MCLGFSENGLGGAFMPLSGKGMLVQNFLVKLGAANDDKFKIWDSPPEDLNSFLLNDSLMVLYPPG